MRLVLVILIGINCFGCASVNRGLSYFHYKDNVTPLISDKRVLVEPGVEERGTRISEKLDSAISVVESFLGSPFSKPIYVTLCKTQKSHVKHCGDYMISSGMMNWGRVFISPLAFERKSEIPVLVHELTHLHTCQRIGIFKFIGDIPAWFSEGLAVIVSNGAGAEEYSDSAAIDWINHGKCFTPAKNGNFIKTSAQNEEALPWDMFYRQASLFVDYVAKSNPVAFQSLIKDMENKINFNKAFINNYNKNIQEEFDDFKESLKTNGTAKKSS
jgi:hypothetical protein